VRLLLAVAIASVSVHGTDSKVTVSPARVPAGTVVFHVTNAGRKAHVFTVQGRRVAVAAGRHASVKAKLGAGTVSIGWSGARTVTLTVTAPPEVTTTAAGTTVGVDMFEYGFTLSETTIPAGTVLFQLTNTGHAPHDFSIEGVGKSSTIGPGGRGTLTVTLAAGTYTYVCTVQGHAQLGMTGTFKVA